MAIPKLERLMNLTAALLDTRVPLSAEQLHRRVGGYPDDRVSFRRSFERDKDDLREMGIPIRMEEIPDSLPRADGYLIRKDEYYLRDPGLTADELAALHLATAAVRIDGVQGLGGLWKLGGTPVDVSGAADSHVVSSDLAADPNVVTVFAAMKDRRVITFAYGGVERTVEPYRLEFQRGSWYLGGFDRTRDARRVYRLDRIAGPVEGVGNPGAFVRPADTDPGLRLEPWLTGAEPPITARVLIDAPVAAAAVHELGSDAVEERRDDGSVVVALTVTNRAAFRTFVLGLLEHAEVLEPQSLRDDIVGWLRARTSEGVV